MGLETCESYNKFKQHEPVCFDSNESCPVCKLMEEIEALTETIGELQETEKENKKTIEEQEEKLDGLCPTCKVANKLNT